MLLIPLHRKPTAANWPWVTTLLIALNVFVFFIGQRHDDQAFVQAQQRWQSLGLASIEAPLFLDWQLRPEAQVDSDTRREALEISRALAEQPDLAGMLFPAIQHDSRFLAALADGGALAERRRELDGDGSWAQERAEVDLAMSRALTWRLALRYDRIEIKRLFGSMFLHGDVGHLLGNMLFLALLGLLVEGALGAPLFALLYLLAGVGSALCSVAWRSGDPGMGVGASGAIAGLMGAYCVLWGMRKVRFFYWFFVVFNYVRAPALVLLPLWLGWELWQLLRNDGSNVAFDAHAGGIVCGALLALVVRLAGWQKEEFLSGDGTVADPHAVRGGGPAGPAASSAVSEAVLAAREAVRVQLGKMDWNAARHAAVKLQGLDSASFDSRLLVWRAWATATGAPSPLHAAARAVLTAEPMRADQCAERKRVWLDYLRASGGRPQLQPMSVLKMGEWFGRQGEFALGLDLLKALHKAPDASPLAAAALLRLALVHIETQPAQALAVQAALAAGWPDAEETSKLHRLLNPG